MAFVRVAVPPLIQGLLACTIILQLLVYATLGVRFYFRKKTKAGYGWDDWLAVTSTVFGSGMVICVGLFSTSGLGYHIEEVEGNLPQVSKTIFAYELIYHCTIGTAKLSALAFYLRVFTRNYIFKYVVAGVVAVCAQSTAVILWSLLICRPISDFWADDNEPFCGNRRPMYMTASVLAILTDIMIIGLPIPVIMKLKMKRSKKKGVIGLFATGVLMSIASVIRIISISWIDETDVTHSATMFMFFSAVEPQVATLCVCLPLMSPLFNRCFGSRSGNTPVSHVSAVNTQTLNSRANPGQGFNRLEDGHDNTYEMYSTRSTQKDKIETSYSHGVKCEVSSTGSVDSVVAPGRRREGSETELVL